MRESRTSENDLGRTLAVVGPHPLSVLIACIPGLIWGFIVLTRLGPGELALLFHPEIELKPGVRPFMWFCLILMLLLLGLGARHFLDRAELCRDGVRILGRAYRFERMGPVSWSHRSQSGMTKFWDQTVMRFTYDGKPVEVKTRYLQDLSYRYHKTYGTDGGPGGAVRRPEYTEVEH